MPSSKKCLWLQESCAIFVYMLRELITRLTRLPHLESESHGACSSGAAFRLPASVQVTASGKSTIALQTHIHFDLVTDTNVRKMAEEPKQISYPENQKDDDKTIQNGLHSTLHRDIAVHQPQ